MNFTVGHVGINVTDLERSLAFYGEVFELRTVNLFQESGREYAFLADGRGLMLTLWKQSTGSFSQTTPGLHHLAFLVEDADKVRDFETRLRARGVELEYDGIVSHGEGKDSGGVFFRDPDGIRLEVYAAEGIGEYGPAKNETPSCGFF
jgi:catechol 2,3-dioxygenase-like lactoylglutathione lyase family enzyme